MAAIPKENPDHGGWKPGDVYLYRSACHTEEAIREAAEYYSVPQARPFVSFECFRLREAPMPMRLVRFVDNLSFPGASPVSIWEVVDMMRDTEFVILMSRDTFIREQESI